MTDTCGCCEGTQLLTPQPVANRPGLDKLSYRVGTHAAFLATMKARLSNYRLDALPGDRDAADRTELPSPLQGLTTRAADDPAIALLDAWATVADVLTFYQERIANEGYLRTASERRSILELARLVGYAPRPGVAATAYLAYTVDENTKDPVIIPRGARVTSVPGPGETPQSFETVEELEARAAWNVLKPRIARPQSVNSIKNILPGTNSDLALGDPHVFLTGINTNLKSNDPLLIDLGADDPAFVRVKDVQPDAAADRTLVTFQVPTITPSVVGDKGGSIYPRTAQTVWPHTTVTFTVLPDAEFAIADVCIDGESKGAILGYEFKDITEDHTIVASFTPASTLAAMSRASINLDAELQIDEIVARYLGVQAVKVDATMTFARVSEYLKALLHPEDEEDFRVDPIAYLEEMLSKLETERQDAEKRGRSNLLPWLEGLIAELREVSLATRATVLEGLNGEIILVKGLKGGAGQRGSLGDPPVSEALLKRLTEHPSRPPANALQLNRNLADVFAGSGDAALQVVQALHPGLRDTLPGALATAQVTDANKIKVYVPRVRASLFGKDAIKRQRLVPGLPRDDRETTETEIIGEWPIVRCDERDLGSIADANSLRPVILALETDKSVHTNLIDFILEKDGHHLTSTTAQTWVNKNEEPYEAFGTIVDGGFCYQLTGVFASGSGYIESLKVNRSKMTVTEVEQIVYLDATYDKILPGSWVVVDPSAVVQTDVAQVTPKLSDNGDVIIASVKTAKAGLQRSQYGLDRSSTLVGLSKPWIEIKIKHSTCGTCPHEDTQQRLADLDFQVIRSTIVYAQFEELPLAEEPVETNICSNDSIIELDGLYDDLQPGRWLIISGERTDTEGSSGVKDSELVMLKDVTHGVLPPTATPTQTPLAGDTTHTYITLSEPLGFCYKRDAVTIYGNVVKATHGETRQEVLGSGDGSKAFQAFTLKQPPLTYVAASTPSGAESALHVRVNGVEWHEASSLVDLGPTDRTFTTRTDDENKTTVVFGDGRQGARPPTGVENIKAVYRSGIGQVGNVKAGQISLLATRPLGVKEVINPLRASGGADRESRDQARKSAPLAVMALDRLVSTQDYADFARAFAGIGKASAVRLSDGRRQLMHVTIAGANDIPIDEGSDLYLNLVKALHVNGDPYQSIMVEVRELMLIVLSANVRLLPDYQWEGVVPRVRARLVDTFSFERRELGQDVLLSQVISAIQSVEGVAYVDVDKLRGIPEKNQSGGLLTPEEIGASVVDEMKDDQDTVIAEPFSRLAVNLASSVNGVTRPAQLAFLTPDVEATLILNEVKT